MSRRAILVAVCLVLAGCGGGLSIHYGSETPGDLDGVSVLLGRLENTTRLRRIWQLSPRLEQDCDLIIHLARSPGLPEPEASSWMSKWLRDGEGRQVVLILRDSSPAPILCRRWATEARNEAGRLTGVAGEELRALADRFERTALSAEGEAWQVPEKGRPLDCGLFTAVPAPPQPPTTIAGLVNGGAVPFTMRAGLLLAADDSESLLTATLPGGAKVPWALSVEVADSRLLVVANATPLLDGALPDPQARALSEKLLHEILAYHHGPRPACAWVASLRVREGEPEQANPMAMAFNSWPLGLVAWHGLALVVVWLAFRAWWLGRRERPHDGHAASFGSHVDALADQLAAGADHQACARAIARASGLPPPPRLSGPDAARAWLAARANDTTEDTR